MIGAKRHNLKGVDVKVPLGVLTVVTGVSGSGKSTLTFQILERSLTRALQGEGVVGCKVIEGIDQVDKVVRINQRPIGRTPRSNPATYTGAMTVIRDLFAATEEARARGYTKSRFSFNVKGGRCEACQRRGREDDRDAVPAERRGALRGPAAGGASTGRPSTSPTRDGRSPRCSR